MKRGRALRIWIVALGIAGGIDIRVRAAEVVPPATIAPGTSAASNSGKPESDARPLPTHTPGIFAPKAASKAPPRPSSPSRRGLSPEMAAKLGFVVHEAVAALPPPSPRRDGIDDADVVRMDPFSVVEQESPEFKEHELRRKKVFDDLAKTLGGSALGGPGIETAAGKELERARGREAKELIDLTRIGGSVLPGMKKVVDEMNTRVNDPRAQNGTPFREPQVNNRF